MLYLSWLTAWNTPFSPTTHAREDEFCIRGSIYEQEEGDIIVSGFEVEIPNPGLGLIGLGRDERYAVLSEKLASDPVAVELARGRVIAVPSEIGQQTLTLRFQSVPPDEDAVLKAAANALRTGEEDGYDPDGPIAPRQKFETYDGLFHPRDARDDPMSALFGRPELWRWDRKTLSIERVSMIDGDVVHAVNQNGFEDTLSVALRNPPRKSTRMRLVASWTQEAQGVQTFPVISEPIDTYSWQDLVQSLPQPGTPVGENTGWHIAESDVTYVNPHGILDEFDVVSEKYTLGDPDILAAKVLLQPATVGVQVRLGYDFQQQREDHLLISMPVAQQNVLGDDKAETVDVINLAALNIDPSTPLWEIYDPISGLPMQYAVGDEVVYNGRKWRCRVAHTSKTYFDYSQWLSISRKGAIAPTAARYFDTNRGVRSVRYAIRMLHRRVLVRARCLEISFQAPWEMARSMTCRDACRVENRKIGEVTAKISAVKLIADGAKRYAEITLLACLGNGSTPPVADDQYDEETGDVTYWMSYPSPSTPTVSGQLPSRVHTVDIINPYADQKASALYEDDPVDVIERMPTRIELDVRPIIEEDLLTRQLTVACSPIWLPQNVIIGS